MTSSSATALPNLESVTLEVDARGVAWITLDREEAANARNQRMRDELSAIYDAVSSDPDVAVVVLTGAGDRFFCAGMDLKESGRPESSIDRRQRLRQHRDIEQLARLPRPTIAAINGYALGGGCEMALACDMRIMANETEIGLPEVNHGLMPGGGGTQRLPRLVGLARAAEMIYLGTRLTGTQAEAIGLVNRAVPATELHAVVHDLAGRVAAKPVVALRAVKEALVAGQELPLSAAVDRELDGLLFLLADADAGPTSGNGRATG